MCDHEKFDAPKEWNPPEHWSALGKFSGAAVHPIPLFLLASMTFIFIVPQLPHVWYLIYSSCIRSDDIGNLLEYITSTMAPPPAADV